MKREEINARLEELRGGIQYLAAFDELDDEQRSAWDEATVEFEELSARATDIAEREAAADRAAKVPTIQIQTAPTTEDVLNDRSATGSQLVDSITRSLEENGVDADGMESARMLLKRHQKDTAWARNLAARATEVYEAAWTKAITGRSEFMVDEERAALAVGTNTAGGFLVPTHLDPTLIITNNGTTNPMRSISRVVTLTDGNVWNGVTTAGSTFSFDAELTEVSDDSPSFGRVSIPLFKAQGFIQASVEMLDDTNIASDVASLIADAKDRLEATAYATGNGTSAPKGIVTCLDANTNSELATTTANALGAVDVDAAYRHTPVRWRGRGKWLAHPLFSGKIRLLATTQGSQFTVDLTQPTASNLYGHEFVESDEMPSTALSTTGQNILIYGDFSNYVIVDKPGSASVHYLPPGILQNTSNNLPDGRVGWYVYWRTGAKSINDVAFTLLQNA